MLFRSQQRHEDALQIYDGVANRSPDNDMRAGAFYNKGNTHIIKNEYDKAIEAYKQSLRLNPNDVDAKKNLAFAKKMQKEQEKKDKNQDKNKQQQQNQDKNQQQNQDKNQQQQQNQDKNQEKNQDKNNPQQQNQDKNSQQTQQQQAPKLTEDNAERLMKIMDNEDQKVQQRLRKGKGQKKTPSAKDW